MILLLPGNALSVVRCGIALSPAHYGWLLTPVRTMTRQGTYGLQWAIDNEVFTGKFEPARFLRALTRIREAHGTDDCLFVVVPDVVGNAQATLERFYLWKDTIRRRGFPVALAAQDGLENLSVPWNSLDALFIGGTTTWKMSDAAATLMYRARQHGKWIHVGRVNSWKRVDELKVKPDSIDGTHWVFRPDKYLREWETERRAREWNKKFGFMSEIKRWRP